MLKECSNPKCTVEYALEFSQCPVCRTPASPDATLVDNTPIVWNQTAPSRQEEESHWIAAWRLVLWGLECIGVILLLWAVIEYANWRSFGLFDFPDKQFRIALLATSILLFCWLSHFLLPRTSSGVHLEGWVLLGLLLYWPTFLIVIMIFFALWI